VKPKRAVPQGAPFMVRRRRSGFTLIELLVVIAMLTILVSLLLPAVQGARMAARRTQNRNNLKQIALALHHYHDTCQVFPPGFIGLTSGLPDMDGLNGWCWAAMILPYLEQGNLYKQLNFSVSVTTPINVAAYQRNLLQVLFRNPNDIGPEKFTIFKDDPPHGPIVDLPTSNYVGSFGSNDPDACDGLPPGNQCVGNGIFFHNSRIRIRDITDGTSHTFLVGQRRTNTDPTLNPQWFSTWVGVVAGGQKDFLRVIAVADHVPDDPIAHFDDFSSIYEQGAHFAYADGSVSFVSDHIDKTVYMGLATRDGGETTYFPD
jgi:prepilin-type N-terminal cleavage/methylation domain-containing protein